MRVIVVTDDHLANLSVSLDVRRMNPEAVIVLRQFDQDLAAHLEQSIKIDRALSASALAVPQFLAAALGTAVNCSFTTGDAIWCMGEHAMGAEISEGRTIGDCLAGGSEAALGPAPRRRSDRALRGGDTGAPGRPRHFVAPG